MRNPKLEHILKQKRKSCFHGWRAWKKAMRATGTSFINDNQTIVLVLSSDNDEYNYFGLLYLNSYLLVTKKKRAVVLGYDSTAIDAAKLFSPRIAAVKLMKKKEIDSIIDLYALYRFRPNIIIADLEHPNGRNGRSLVGKRGITVEDMVSVGIYRLYPVRRPSPPMYFGGDPSIIRFLEVGRENPYIPDTSNVAK